jgi:aspartyl-tRNA(Asn)/glutamyl-tRNA(Gln) amidotransferase subunit A
MADSEFWRWPATRIAAAVRARAVSPVEIVRAALARAEAIQPKLNCFTSIFADEALAAAKRAEAAALRGESPTLLGVPFTIKDNLPSAGHRTTNGSYVFETQVTRSDCLVAARMRQAGAILIGKTTTPEFAHKVLTDSPLWGVTKSPWSQAHTPGGSSGGGAASTAAGAAPLAIGTDGGGSIRCPAACSNLVGMKATLGRVPFETFPDAFILYAFTGPMTRTVADNSAMLAAMSGPAPEDAYSLSQPPWPAPELAESSVKGLKIGWVERFGGVEIDSEVAAETGAAMKALETAGAVVEPLDDRAFDDLFDCYVVIATTAHAARAGTVVAKHGSRMSESFLACIAQGKTWSAVDWQRASDRRTALFRAVQQMFKRFDLIATPTLNAPPKPLDAGGAINTPMYAAWASSLYPFNLTGHPAASIPAGFTASGLPMGLQLIGPWYGEERIYRAARVLEQVRPWLRWPAIS